MENRFGVKDFVIFLLLVIVIVMIWLCMSQYDRQWEVINQASNQLRDQTKDLTSIRRLLEQGGAPAASGKTAGDPNVGFERIIKAHSNSDYAAGDAIVNTMLAGPARLTPLISFEQSAFTVRSFVMDTLCVRNPATFAWTPRLAISWHTSADQLSFDFELRHGVTFADGEPFTADDVIFTYDFERNEKIEAPVARAYLDKLDHIEKTGDYAVRFVFKEPYYDSFEVLADTQILSKKFYSQFTPKEFNESTGLLFGSGPYRLVDPKSWRPEPGKPIELIRNERYWGVAPAFNRIIWKVIGNPSARVTAFRNGETDLYAPTPEQYDSLCNDPALVARTQHFALDNPGSGYRYISWSESIGGKPTRFADKRVRQAMTMLIDRQAIVKDVVHGYATVNSGMFSALTPQADPSITPLPFDPAKAEQLLADAGFTKQNGVLTSKDGRPFEFKLTYASVSSTGAQIASFVKDSMAKAGIVVNLAPTESAIMVQQMKDKSVEAMLGGWTGVLEQDPHQIFCTDAMAGTGNNYVSYSNKELDQLVAQARSTVNDDDRMQIWHHVHRIVAEDQPYTFLFEPKDLSFVDGRFKAVMPTKLGLNSINEWYVPATLQKYKD